MNFCATHDASPQTAVSAKVKSVVVSLASKNSLSFASALVDAALHLGDLAEGVPLVGVIGTVVKKVAKVIKDGKATYDQLKEAAPALVYLLELFGALTALYRNLPTQEQVT